MLYALPSGRTAITFAGSASDPEDGDLTNQLVWTSNLQGQIDTGSGFSAVLWDGTHTITASVTDSGGNEAEDNITLTVTVVGDNPPTVSISAPADGASFETGTEVSFAGTASDDEDGDLSEDLVWTSSIDGGIGSGANFSTSALSVGTHTISASATDTGDLTGEDSITLVVQPTAGGTVTVISLTGTSTTINRNFWRANVTATINPPLSGAVVSGVWDSGSSATCTTDSLGQCDVTITIRTRTSSTTTFTVSDVALVSYDYVPGVTTVTVNMP